MDVFGDNNVLRLESKLLLSESDLKQLLTLPRCVPVETISYPMSFRPIIQELHLRDAPVFSTDGQCGGDVVCDPNSKVYTGGCCSVSCNDKYD